MPKYETPGPYHIGQRVWERMRVYDEDTGEVVKHCVAVDTDLGTATQYQTDDGGNFIISLCGKHI